jgi:hypothetical protein
LRTSGGAYFTEPPHLSKPASRKAGTICPLVQVALIAFMAHLRWPSIMIIHAF